MNQRRTFTTRVERVRLAASWSSDVQTRYWREDVCFMLHCWCGSLKQKTGWKVCKTPILSILPLKNTQGKWATSHARFCIFFYLLSWLFAEREFHIHTQGTRVAANVKSRLFCTRRLLLVTRLAVRLFLHLFFCDTENSSAATCVRIRPVLCKQKEKKTDGKTILSNVFNAPQVTWMYWCVALQWMWSSYLDPKSCSPHW